MEIKKISRAALESELESRLSDAANAQVMPPILNIQLGTRPNWSVPQARDARFRKVIEIMQSEFDLREDLCPACHDQDRKPAGEVSHKDLTLFPMQNTFGDPMESMTAPTETRWRCVECDAQFVQRAGERWRLVGDDVDD